MACLDAWEEPQKERQVMVAKGNALEREQSDAGCGDSLAQRCQPARVARAARCSRRSLNNVYIYIYTYRHMYIAIYRHMFTCIAMQCGVRTESVAVAAGARLKLRRQRPGWARGPVGKLKVLWVKVHSGVAETREAGGLLQSIHGAGQLGALEHAKGARERRQRDETRVRGLVLGLQRREAAQLCGAAGSWSCESAGPAA